MILHTVNKSPLQHGALSSCLRFMNAADALLLLEDGVYGAIGEIDCGLEQVTGSIYALAADVRARGLQDRVGEHVSVVDYETFVDLCVEATAVKNWS